MENVQEPVEGRPPEVTEAQEIAELLTKRAHCPHDFRYAIIAEHKETLEDTMFTWCQHCGTGQRTVFVDEEEVS